mmetsp:Transcript_15466/g.20937  ORF Transcript_15466/g.20937 Transcript_15466/m.20937 type:complete len:80 (+) Transcript_15466:31-270(+)
MISMIDCVAGWLAGEQACVNAHELSHSILSDALTLNRVGTVAVESESEFVLHLLVGFEIRSLRVTAVFDNLVVFLAANL